MSFPKEPLHMCIQRLRRNYKLGIPCAGVLNEITVAGQMEESKRQGVLLRCSKCESSEHCVSRAGLLNQTPLNSDPPSALVSCTTWG